MVIHISKFGIATLFYDNEHRSRH